MSRKLSILLLGLLAGIAGGLLVLAVDRIAPAGRVPDVEGSPYPIADLLAVLESNRALDQRVARIEAELVSRGASAMREPVKLAASSTDTPEPNAAPSMEQVTLREELLRTTQRVELLENGLKDSGLRWLRTPSREQFERARKDVDWALVDEIRALHHQDYAAALERVSAMSIDDILQQIGKPTGTAQGLWWYTRPRPGGNELSVYGISLSFAGQRVVGVGLSN